MVVQPESVGADVAGDRGDPPRCHLGERFPSGLGELGSQPVEGVVLEDLPFGPFGGAGSLSGTDEQHEVAVGHAAQQPFHERRADEPGGPRDGDGLAGERLGDHGVLF